MSAVLLGTWLAACDSGTSASRPQFASADPELSAPKDGRPGDADSGVASDPRPQDFADVAARVGPSVVAVVTTVATADTPESANGGVTVRRGIGAGVVVSPREIVTNDHVVASSATVEVHLVDGSRRTAHIVHSDPLVDLSLIAVDDGPPLVPLALRLGPARVGEWVMAVGQPYGLSSTVTVGVVSGIGRDYVDLGRPKGLRADGVWSFIQTDASINIGNSGGPLLDARGELVGITTAVRKDGQGLAFAVPAELVVKYLDEVSAHGRLRRPRLGLRVDDLGPDEHPLRARGVKVVRVEPDGPAATAGVKVDDIVLSACKRPLLRVSDLAYAALMCGLDAPWDLELLRGDSHLTLPITPHESP